MTTATTGPFSRRRLAQDIANLRTDLTRVRPFIAGLKIFVNSATGTNNATSGTSPTTPVATLAYALTLIGSYALQVGVPQFDNMIVVMAGHTETIHTAGFWSGFSSGTRIIGLGSGRKRPVFTWDATDATVLVDGANVVFENIVFDFTGIDAVVAGIKVDAADVRFDNCEFITNVAAAGVVSGITVGATTTSPRFAIENCFFRGPAVNSGTTTTAQVTITDAPDFVFRRNYCTGKMTQSITNAAANLRGTIHDNVFVIATGTKAINMHASSTPMITNNRINVPSGTAPVVAAAGFVAGNAYSAAAGVTAGTALTW